jgi:hypothetical protein
MTFQPAGPLSIGPGLTLTSDLGSAYYAITAPATTAPFINVSVGATLSGFSVDNGNATGNAIQSLCSASGTVTIKYVDVVGNGIGNAGFQTGVYHSGGCNLDLESSTISGVSDSGVILDTTATSSVTLLGNVVASNNGTTEYLGVLARKAGGLVLSGAMPTTFSAAGNQFYGNTGDQILVVAASGALNVSGAACDATSNIITCYSGGGVGIYSNGASVNASFDSWLVSSPRLNYDFVGDVTVNSPCAQSTITCPQ